MDSDKQVNLQQPGVTEMSQHDLAMQSYIQDQDPLQALCNSEIIDPVALQFIPKSTWASWKPTSVQGLHDTYFSRKNSVSRRFEHKLWNALQITTRRPDLYPAVGVMWVSETIIQVNRVIFGKLLGLEKSTSALFNMQGSFPTHGFTELTLDEVRIVAGVKSTTSDFDECRFFVRKDGKFTRHSKEADVMACSYQKPPALVWA